MDESFNSRLWKTTLFLGWRKAFTRLMRLEVEKMIRRCRKASQGTSGDLTFSLRWNGSSDVPAASRRLASQYPEAVFYDYTKNARAALKNGAGLDPVNYFLSYSFDGTPAGIKKARRVLKAGGRVSAVFNLLPGITSADGSYRRPPEKLPARFLGFPVNTDGDEHDYIPADKPGVRGLRFKAAVDRAGSLEAAGPFVVDPCGELCQ